VESPNVQVPTSGKVSVGAFQGMFGTTACFPKHPAVFQTIHVIHDTSGNHTDLQILQRCYGCGALLQIVQEETPGYVPPEKYSLKQKHHQLGTLICRRASATL